MTHRSLLTIVGLMTLALAGCGGTTLVDTGAVCVDGCQFVTTVESGATEPDALLEAARPLLAKAFSDPRRAGGPVTISVADLQNLDTKVPVVWVLSCPGDAQADWEQATADGVASLCEQRYE